MNDTTVLKKELQKIPNVGPAIAQDLVLLGVKEVSQLAGMDPDDMYDRLCQISGSRQDPCVWDTFAAVVDYAKRGEPKPWWSFTAERKKRWAEQGRGKQS